MASTSLLAALLPLCAALLAPKTQLHRIKPTRAVVNYEVEAGGEARATPLSDDFDGAVQALRPRELDCLAKLRRDL